VFDRNDVCQALGYEPDRNSLFRILNELVQDGRLLIVQRGGGRVPTRYSRPETQPGTQARSITGRSGVIAPADAGIPEAG